MDKFIINGGKKLRGNVRLKAAKNSVLALAAASILTDEDVVLKNCPSLTDIVNKLKIINGLGAKVLCNGEDIFINAKNASDGSIPGSLAKSLRSSFVLLGPIAARFGKARVCMPGGCSIGKRPVDIHLKAFREMGAKITEMGNSVICDASNLRGTDVVFKFPSVGATQNIMMAASLADGVTTISNAAKEPEIGDLQGLLNKMGAKVSGAGTSVVTVEGVKRLHGAVYAPVPDRIVAGTLTIAAAICGGELTVENCCPHHLFSLFGVLRDNNCSIEYGDDRLVVKSDGHLTALPDITTGPYPFFPTDLQPQISALASVSQGVTKITEKVFENRFNHVCELEKMGARVYINEQTAFFRGVDELRGADVKAYDLRCGAALIIAALKAKGISVIEQAEYIDRGYENIEETLRSLGADIIRVGEKKKKPLGKIFDR